MKERVQQLIEQIRPNLQADGGDIELVEVTDDGIVKVRLQGACHGCPGAAMTLKMGVERPHQGSHTRNQSGRERRLNHPMNVSAVCKKPHVPPALKIFSGGRCGLNLRSSPFAGLVSFYMELLGEGCIIWFSRGCSLFPPGSTGA